MRLAATTIVAIATAFLALASASPDLVVDTKFGQVMGADEGTYSAFKGIPYAASTAGENRWTAPKDPEPWEDVRDATEYRSICPQAADEGSAFFEEFSEVLGVESPAPPNFTISEDCLVLNVFTPSLNGSAPVMVWIHGGALVTGAGEQYPADGLVSHDVVVVTINYRLGFLGYFAHPDLQDTNFGLLDQVKALEWVQENIAQFGGDPNQVTIFGESAGGVSVLALTVSPLAEGLFRGAIAQSSAIMESLNVTREEAGDLGVAVGNFVNATGIPLYGISQISQMRSVPAEAYLEAMQAFQVSPAGPMAFLYKDNKSLPVSVYEGFQTGAQHQGVNMMIGMNENETTPFLMPINATSPITTESYTTFVDNAFGTNESDVQIVMENIPANSDEDAFAAYTELWTDLFFGSSSFGVAQGSASSGASTWFYMFDYEYEAAPMLGAYHAIEVSDFTCVDMSGEMTEAGTD